MLSVSLVQPYPAKSFQTRHCHWYSKEMFDTSSQTFQSALSNWPWLQSLVNLEFLFRWEYLAIQQLKNTSEKVDRFDIERWRLDGSAAKRGFGFFFVLFNLKFFKNVEFCQVEVYIVISLWKLMNTWIRKIVEFTMDVDLDTSHQHTARGGTEREVEVFLQVRFRCSGKLFAKFFSVKNKSNTNSIMSRQRWPWRPEIFKRFTF